MTTPSEPLPPVQHRPSVFGYRDFRLYFFGQAISQIGTWMQATALPWLVYDRTGSAWLLGVIGACTYLPLFLLGPVAGVVADRLDRRTILLATQTVAMLQAFLLAGLTLAGVIDTTTIILLALVAGVATGFDTPAAQAFVSDLVPDEAELPRAVAVNAVMVNLTRMLAPALAGVLISLVGSGRGGEGSCFLLNGVSFLAVLVSLAAIRTRRTLPTTKAAPLTTALREGFGYTFSFVPLRDLLLMASLVGLVGIPTTLVPMIATHIDGGGASIYGFLTAAAGAGALLGAVYVATRRGRQGADLRITIGAAGLGLSLVGFALSTSLTAALLCRFLAGLCMMIQITTCNGLVQLMVEPDKRGRVLSLFNMAFLGMAALGNLATGAIAGAIGAENTLFLTGGCCLLSALGFGLRLPALRSHMLAVPAIEHAHAPVSIH